MNPLVSIIIPVYNIEQWLESCLKSVLNQTFLNWEALVVIDGSPDNSINIASKYSKKDERFKIFNIENVGLGGARNYGASKALGDYIFFLDGDDMLFENAIDVMYRKAISTNADYVVSDYYQFLDGEGPCSEEMKFHSCSDHYLKTFSQLPLVFDWRDIKSNFDLLFMSTYFCTAWGKMMKKETWEAGECIVPKNLRMAEDFIPIKKMVILSNRISWVKSSTVLYRKRLNSATSKRSIKSFEVFNASEAALEEFFPMVGFEDFKKHLTHFIFNLLKNHMLYYTPFHLWPKFYYKLYLFSYSLVSSDPKIEVYSEFYDVEKKPLRSFIKILLYSNDRLAEFINKIKN